jgi:predicted deacylase
MRELAMLPKRKRPVRQIEPQIAASTAWVRAPASGIVRSLAKLGQRVKKDEVLMAISDPFGETEINVTAPNAGIIIGKTNLPLAHEGDALLHIARFDSVSLAENIVEEFQSEIFPEQVPTEI